MSSGDGAEPDGHSRDEILRSVFSALDGGLPMTLRDIYRANLKYSWTEFTEVMTRLISEGLIEGKGDGFVVHYALTNRGQNAVLKSNNVKAVGATT